MLPQKFYGEITVTNILLTEFEIENNLLIHLCKVRRWNEVII